MMSFKYGLILLRYSSLDKKKHMNVHGQSTWSYVNVTKVFQKMKNKSLLSIEKKYYRTKKGFFIIKREYFNLEKLVSL